MLKISPSSWIAIAFITASGMRLLETDTHAIAAEVISNAISKTQNETPVSAGTHDTSGDRPMDLLEVVLEAQDTIKKREAAVLTRERDLIALEEALQVQMERLEATEERLSAQLKIASGVAADDVDRLAKMYANMRPETAAEVFSQMEPAFAAGFIRKIPEDIAANILSELPPGMAYSISVTLAGQHQNLVRQ